MAPPTNPSGSPILLLLAASHDLHHTNPVKLPLPLNNLQIMCNPVTTTTIPHTIQTSAAATVTSPTPLILEQTAPALLAGYASAVAPCRGTSVFDSSTVSHYSFSST
ncbi:hypothetical protein PCANC_11643 [Puccinia coronata f. sp. avenae]|uniref:Uncharacterized protein n=1 Tax=Puccinia coronata f. sp. avenae TaxID=200324 RepID=A0A2N5VXF3_9BASI|nr:hypothetical protein PCASD_10411 [Puccinia coronata f. sp. avenae]PLW54673.1 hypothetical protein PCANC_11643 [Puccinia coronata f. sp. avenae]